MMRFQELYYTYKTRDYVDISTTQTLTEPQLHAVLQGKIHNPHRKQFKGHATDYSFFIASNPALLQAMEFVPFYVTLLEESEWYGLFSCESSSSIILPRKKECIIDPQRSLHITIPLHQSVWFNGGNFQADKRIGTRIIPTTVSAQHLEEIISFYYKK